MCVLSFLLFQTVFIMKFCLLAKMEIKELNLDLLTHLGAGGIDVPCIDARIAPKVCAQGENASKGCISHTEATISVLLFSKNILN